MLKSMLGTEKKTLVEEARSRMKRGKRKHQEALVDLADALFKLVPEVVFASAELNNSRTAWDMRKSSAFTAMDVQNKWLTLGNENITPLEWKQVHDSVVSRLKAEPDLAWRVFDETTPSTLVLIWETI